VTSQPSQPDPSEEHVHHAIDYVELGAGGRLQEVCDFYAGAFGWAFTPYGPSYAGIRWSRGDGEVGGISDDTPGSRGGPLVLLWSADLDATLEAVRTAGGEVSTEPYTFPGGRRFHFLDPAGNELGVWSDH
jgi:predicted enzyme related to lactoylglutathione lyase